MKLRNVAWRTCMTISSKVSPVLIKIPGVNRVRASMAGSVRGIFQDTLPNPIEVHGVKLFWDSQKVNDAIEIGLNDYERETRLLFQKLLRQGNNVVDVGAHIGFYSLLSAQLVGNNGKVYAFEPNPTNYSLLVKNIGINNFNDIVIPENKAVSNRRGQLPMFLNGGESSLYVSSSTDKSVIVEVITLDEYFGKLNWPEIHLLKMDIEGAENVALQGMKELVRKNPQLKLVIEFNPETLLAAKVTPEKLFGTLTDIGFLNFSIIQDKLKLIKIPDDIQTLIGNTKGYSNLLCER